MSKSKDVRIESVDPRRPEVRQLIEELDAYMHGLYPTESIHKVDVESLAQPEVRFFAGLMEGEPAGCAAIMLRADGPASYAEVKRVYVAPRARGLGMGKLLLRQLEAETRRLGLALMRLETGVHQPEALALFAAAGFKNCGPFGGYPTGDPLSVFMEKRLSK